MKSLTDVYNQVASHDAELEKQAAELVKQAEEEDAAGRITARGFADELAKLAEGYGGGAGAFDTGPKGGSFGGDAGGTVKSKPFSTGGGNTGGGFDPMKGRGAASSQAAAQAGGGSVRPVGTGQKPGGGGGAAKSMAAKPTPAKPPQVAMGGSKPPGM